MDRDNLARLNEAVTSPQGQEIINYMCEYMIDMASKSGANAEWIKGMGMLIFHVKDIEQQFLREINNGRK